MPKITILRKTVECHQVQAWFVFFAVVFYVSAAVVITISFAKTPLDYLILTEFATLFLLTGAAVSMMLAVSLIADGYPRMGPPLAFILCSTSFFYICFTQIIVLTAKSEPIRWYTGINIAVYSANFVISYVLIRKRYNSQIALEEHIPLTQEQQQQSVNEAWFFGFKT